MGEPIVNDTTSEDGIEALGGERLEPIWSELDFISNGDLRDLFTPPDIRVGKSDSGNVENFEDDGSGANGAQQIEIAADFWTREERRNCERRSKMDTLVKVKEEPAEVPPVQNGAKLLRVKEEEVTFGDWRQEMNASVVFPVKQEEAVSQVLRHKESGMMMVKVKEEPRNELDGLQVGAVENSTQLDVRIVHSAAPSRDAECSRLQRIPVEDTRMSDVIKLPIDPPAESSINVGAKCNESQAGPLEDACMNEIDLSSDAAIAVTENNNLQKQGVKCTEHNGAEMRITDDAGRNEIQHRTEGGFQTEESPSSIPEASTAQESTAIVLQTPQYEVHHDGLGSVLKNGILSSTGLGKMGLVLVNDSSTEAESESSEEEEDSEEESESDDDDSSDISSSEEDEEMRTIKEKIRNCEETKEEIEPPRTKNEVSVLPPVPKVEAVLQPHHVCISIGIVLSVVDRYIVVEGKEDSTVVNDGSILWLSESRVPLGIVDEVFGPVRRPYYSLRFNEVAEIHESAKVGADVGYVQEFAEFVLKDNPSLYKKAIDASGLDDEELSEEEIEFSDDEKEMAAKQKDKAKRTQETKENGASAWNSSELQPSEGKGKWQRRERGRGRGSNRGGRHIMGVDSAMADMDLQGSGYKAGNMNYESRSRGRPGAGRAQFQNRPPQSSSGSRDREDSGAAYSSRLQDGLNGRGEWMSSPTRHSPRAAPSSNGVYHQVPVRREETRDGQWFSEPVADADRQPRQAGGIQGVPYFGGTPLPRHSQGFAAEPRQQLGSSYPTFGYTPLPASQIATDGQGNFFHIRGPVNLPPDVGGIGRMGMNVGPTVMNVLPPSVPNSLSGYNNPVQGSLNMRQGGYDPGYQADRGYNGQHGGYLAPSPGYSSNSRAAAPEFRFQAMPSNGPHSGPGGMGRPQGLGYGRGTPPAQRQRFQGPRGR
ncbi:hypothetical protein R1sor_026931 [Riccia sorocarpa]|uniref:H/ACA ribonucleoprotein complex non-core subunit NAF1 n=1 Tax=Riccia sorocarpa TaxID=122646 RepID=A0ABD3GCU2_9MARC